MCAERRRESPESAGVVCDGGGGDEESRERERDGCGWGAALGFNERDQKSKRHPPMDSRRSFIGPSEVPRIEPTSNPISIVRSHPS